MLQRARSIEDLDPQGQELLEQVRKQPHCLQRRPEITVQGLDRVNCGIILATAVRTSRIRDLDAATLLGILHRSRKRRGPHTAAGYTTDGKEMVREIGAPRLHVAQEVSG